MSPHLKDNLTPHTLALLEALENALHDVLEELDASEAPEAVYVGVGAHIAKCALDLFTFVPTPTDD